LVLETTERALVAVELDGKLLPVEDAERSEDAARVVIVRDGGF